MKLFTPTLALVLFFLFSGPGGMESAMAQRKSDLLMTIDSLEARILQAESDLSEARGREKASLAKAESYEAQVLELKDANATLLENLSNFAEVSNTNNASLTKALAALEAREAELKGIVERYSRNDSVIIALLSDAKRTLGPDAKLSVAGGSLVISGSLTDLFGSDTEVEVQEGVQTWLSGIAGLAQAYPELSLTVEGLSMTGELSTASRQATSVMNILRESHGIDPARMSARGKDGNFSEGVNILLHPNYRSFYASIKSEMKQ